MTERESCLLKAIGKVNGNGGDNYGAPENNLQNIANLWSAFLSNKFSTRSIGTIVRITTAEVAQMMALFKLGRIQGKHSVEDSYVDACGYIACGYECECKNEKFEKGK